MIQYLVRFVCIRMMIGVTLQLEQKEITEQVAGIPGVQRIHLLEPVRRNFLTHDAIMLYVINKLQQGKCKEALTEEK